MVTHRKIMTTPSTTLGSSATSAGAAASEQLLAACIGLVQHAETLRAPDLEQVAVLALQNVAASTNRERAMLAFAIERTCDELIANRVAPGVSLPALCMAADQLVNDAPGIAAARFEIDTLLPVPGAMPASAPLLASDTLLRNAHRGTGLPPRDPLLQLRARRLARAEQCPVAQRDARSHYDV